MVAKAIQWPNGARCAAAITFDIDAESGVHLLRRVEDSKHALHLSWGRYEEEAVGRILDIYERQGIRQTFFMPGWCIERYPDTVDAVLKGGHEIGIHGHVHVQPDKLSRDEERRLFEASLEAYASRVGGSPLGYRAPQYGFSDLTAELLAEQGILYDSSLMGSDLPYILRAARGDVIELPVEWANDDWVQFAMAPFSGWTMQTRSAADGMAVFREELEAARELGGLWIAVWHPTVTGRPSRARRVEQLIELMRSWGDVWLAPLSEIAQHVRQSIADGSYCPRVDEMPYRI